MSSFDKYITQKSTIERMTLVFPFSEREEVTDALEEGGWWITRSGPYTDTKMYPKVDVTRSLYHVEREVEDE